MKQLSNGVGSGFNYDYYGFGAAYGFNLRGYGDGILNFSESYGYENFMDGRKICVFFQITFEFYSYEYSDDYIYPLILEPL